MNEKIMSVKMWMIIVATFQDMRKEVITWNR